jgi:phosphoglycerate dehydrogenase-like enzyme
MALAAAKRLIMEHESLKRGQFNQFTWNRMLAAGVCGIFGFGGIGAATARLMYGIGMRVHAINRHGRTDQRVDWIGTPERLNDLLEVADVLLISAPLTRATYGLIGAAELGHGHEVDEAVNAMTAALTAVAKAASVSGSGSA